MTLYKYVVISEGKPPQFFNHPTNVRSPNHPGEVCIRITQPSYFYTPMRLGKDDWIWTDAQDILDAPPHIQAIYALLS